MTAPLLLANVAFAVSGPPFFLLALLWIVATSRASPAIACKPLATVWFLGISRRWLWVLIVAVTCGRGCGGVAEKAATELPAPPA